MTSRYDAVIGRTPSQLRELGNSILVGLDGRVALDQVPAPLSRVGVKEPPPAVAKPLLDPSEEITPFFSHGSLQDDADKKVWKGVWSRAGPKIAQQHFFAAPSGADQDLTERFAEVVKRLNLASDAVLNTFLESVAQTGVDAELIPLWRFLASVMPDDADHRLMADPSQGARRFFEERFLEHVTKVAEDSGMATGRQSDAIRIYVHTKREHGDGVYPTWMLIYYAIRCGDYRSATEFASNAFFPHGCRCESPEHYLRSIMQRPLHFSRFRFVELENACSQFLRYGARKKLNSEYRYMLMSMAFLCGQITVADRLISESAQKWDSLDEFLWFTLGCVRVSNDNASRFDFKRLRSRLSSFEEQYYTENGKRPLRYALVLFSGLQFGSGLYYMLTQDAGRRYGAHVVHMAIALQRHGLLEMADASDPRQLKREDVADLVLQYGRSLAVSHSHLAWHYYYLSRKLTTETVGQLSESDKAACLVDLLERSRDPNLVIYSDAFGFYVRDGETLKRIFQRGAEVSLQQNQFEIAIELYKAANCYERALECCNRMAADLLKACAVLEDAVYRPMRFERLREVRRALDYARDILGVQNEESKALEKICEFLEADQREDHRSAVNKVHLFEFMPRTEDDVPGMIEALQDRFPTVIPLIYSLIHLFCKNAMNLDWAHTTPENRDAVLKRMDVLDQFVRGIPPPFTDSHKACNELQDTANELHQLCM